MGRVMGRVIAKAEREDAMRMRDGVITRLGFSLALLAASCRADGLESTGTDGTGKEVPAGVLLSAPIPASALPAGSEGITSTGGTVGFVSAVPGTFAGATRVQVSNGRTGEVRSVDLVMGGFDPVALAAAAGDTLTVAAANSASDTTATAEQLKRGVAPRVVRTEPVASRTDVPLNAIIRVVFSAPMAPPSVTAGVHVSTGGVEVPGSVRPVADDPVTVVFVPEGALQPQTRYEIGVDAGIQDLAGNQLGTAVSVSFTTGVAAGQITQVLVNWPNIPMAVGGQVLMSALAVGPSGPVTSDCGWSTSAAAVASITDAGLLTALAPGATTIRATCGGVSDEVTATVVPNPLGSHVVMFLVDDPGASNRTRWYRMDGSGSAPTLLREGDETERGPLLSPDGQRIAFVRAGSSTSGLNVMNVDGSDATQLIESASALVGWSSDGTRLYFLEPSRSGEVTLSVIDAAGGSPDRLATLTESFGHRLSPDGSTIVFAQDTAQPLGSPYFYDRTTALHVINVDGTGERTLVTAGLEIPQPFGPAWSPDGRRIAFSGGVCDIGPVVANLYQIRPDGSELSVLIQNPPGTACAGTPVWSPDGTRLAVSTHDPNYGPPAGLMTLTIIDATGQRVGGYSTTWWVAASAWSPDGTMLASLVFQGDATMSLYLSSPAGAAPVLLAAKAKGMVFLR